MRELQSIQRPDGKDCPAYLATPEGDAKGAIVVIQEWWGLNDQIKRTADRFAAQGYVALVPDLYRGKLTQEANEAEHMMGELDFVDASAQDIRGSVQHLKKQGVHQVAISGFCMGGALTILSALNTPEASMGLCFYGLPPAEAADPGQLSVPMQFHFAEHDDWCTPEAVDELEKKLEAGDVAYELYRYEAQHAFMNEQRPEVYDEAAAKQAWERAIAFLGKHSG